MKRSKRSAASAVTGAAQAVDPRLSPRTTSDGPFRHEGRVAPGRPVPIINCLRDENWFVGEELRLLAARVRELRRERNVHCFALSSALPGEGKSTVCVGLATALSREPGRRILLIEADLRRPSIGRTLALPAVSGLAEFLNGSAAGVPIRTVEPGGFDLLVAGLVELDRPETLGSPKMAALLHAARARYDFVLVDSPPLIPVADSVLFQEVVDGFLLVVRSRHTPRAAVDEALAKLRTGAVLGIVLNDHHVYRDSYRASAYERYGRGGQTDESSQHEPRRGR